MLWSLIKIVLFFCIVAALSYGAVELLQFDGGIRIALAGQEYNLGPLQAVIALVLLVIAVWLFLKLMGLLVATFHFLNGDETAISRYFDRNRERKGFQALADGMLALASGEGRLAMAKAARAERYLERPDLTNLLTAQAAEMSGDKAKAEEAYKRLLSEDRTRFVGVRGIMKQRLEAGETDKALKLAKTAFSLKPQHAETQDTLLKLQAEKSDWSGARETLKAKLKHGNVPRDVHKRRDAVLALSEARDVMSEDAGVEAQEKAIEANRLSPDLVPAAIMAARSYIEQDKPRYATRVVVKAWEAQPHPDLAAVFAEIVPDETPEKRIKRFRKLTKLHPEHAETRMLLAELHIAAEDFPEAKRALGDLAETEGDARALTIMAAIERGQGASDTVVKGWLARAIMAPRGPQWVCGNCQHIQAEWTPTCDNCDALDTLAWKRPPQADVSAPTGVEMLPLIVGAIEDRSDETPSETEDASETVEEAEIVETNAAESKG